MWLLKQRASVLPSLMSAQDTLLVPWAIGEQEITMVSFGQLVSVLPTLFRFFCWLNSYVFTVGHPLFLLSSTTGLRTFASSFQGFLISRNPNHRVLSFSLPKSHCLSWQPASCSHFVKEEPQPCLDSIVLKIDGKSQWIQGRSLLLIAEQMGGLWAW